VQFVRSRWIPLRPFRWRLHIYSALYVWCATGGGIVLSTTCLPFFEPEKTLRAFINFSKFAGKLEAEGDGWDWTLTNRIGGAAGVATGKRGRIAIAGALVTGTGRLRVAKTFLVIGNDCVLQKKPENSI
jgi:hypothetical protein